MRTEFRPDEKAVLAPPHPGDFGIPREHWGKAQNFADYWWRKNQVAATPQQQAEPVGGNTLLKAFLAAAKEAGVTHLQQAEPLAQPISFAGLTLTEVRVPFGMTVRFEGGALIIEATSP